MGHSVRMFAGPLPSLRPFLAAVAIHPNDAPAYAEAGRLDEAIAVIDRLATQSRVRAIGETGLDFFRDRAPIAW